MNEFDIQECEKNFREHFPSLYRKLYKIESESTDTLIFKEQFEKLIEIARKQNESRIR